MVWKLRTSFTGALLRTENKKVAVFSIGMICPVSPLFKGFAGILSFWWAYMRDRKGQSLHIFPIAFFFTTNSSLTQINAASFGILVKTTIFQANSYQTVPKLYVPVFLVQIGSD